MLSLLLHSFAVASPIERQVYAGAKVVRFNVTNAAQLRTVQSLVSSGKARYLADTAMDLIIPAHVDYSKVDVPSTCIVDDLQALIDKEEAYSRSTENQFAGDAFFKDYRNADEYVDYLKAQPNVTSFNLGQTYENRTVVALQFGSGPKYIILQGGMHAREWISPAALTYVASFLTSSDPKALELNRKFTFIVVPVLNPDGYAFSRLKSKGDRLWRKNRQPTGDPNCPGIDINRSYKFKFGGPGSSSDKCDEAYRGPEPFAAIEATFVTRLIEKLGPKNVISYTDFHSYGQLFIYPTGVDCRTPLPGREDIDKAAKLARKAIQKETAEFYDSGPFCNIPASGSSDDHTYNMGVKFVYTLELRDEGKAGFLLPAYDIIPTGKEALKAMLAIWDYASQ